MSIQGISRSRLTVALMLELSQTQKPDRAAGISPLNSPPEAHPSMGILEAVQEKPPSGMPASEGVPVFTVLTDDVPSSRLLLAGEGFELERIEARAAVLGTGAVEQQENVELPPQQSLFEQYVRLVKALTNEGRPSVLRKTIIA